MTRLHTITASLTVLVGFAGPLAAQAAATNSNHAVPPSRAAVNTAPTPTALVVTSASAQFSASASSDRLTRPAISPEATGASIVARSRGEGSTLMIVGGAAIVTGILIDEHVITVAGALVGLYGLYLYVR